jgi:hypothetical protein
MIVFDPGPHTYTRNGSRYISATQLIDRYVPRFDSEYWSIYKAVKDILTITGRFDEYKKWCGGWKNIPEKFKAKGFKDKVVEYEVVKRQNHYLAQWKTANLDACERGSSIHDNLEGAVNNARHVEIDKTALPVFEGEKHRHIPDLSRPGIYTEMYIWNDEFRVAGKSDIVIVPKARRARIKDYKTNKKITTEPFDNQCLLGPLSHVPNTKLHIYTLQLSLYGYMLECWGFKIEDLELIHITDDCEPKHINLYYYRDEVIDMLKHYKSGEEPTAVPAKGLVEATGGERVFRF